MINVLLPSEWVRPKGYAQGVVTQGNLIFISGQLGWDNQYKIVSPNYVEQVEMALKNIVELLGCAGATTSNLVKLNWYVTNKADYLTNALEVGQLYRQIINNYNVTMNAMAVNDLMVDGALVQIEAVAVIATA